jgi:hypothetical protein
VGEQRKLLGVFTQCHVGADQAGDDIERRLGFLSRISSLPRSIRLRPS